MCILDSVRSDECIHFNILEFSSFILLLLHVNKRRKKMYFNQICTLNEMKNKLLAMYTSPHVMLKCKAYNYTFVRSSVKRT